HPRSDTPFPPGLGWARHDGDEIVDDGAAALAAEASRLRDRAARVARPEVRARSGAAGGVLDLADELLDDVFEEEHPAGRAGLVERPREVHARAAHRGERVLEVRALEDRDQTTDALGRHRLGELAVVE